MKRIKLFENFDSAYLEDWADSHGIDLKSLKGSVDSGEMAVSRVYDWKEWEDARDFYDSMIGGFKYCYNAHAGHDSFLLVFSKEKVPGCKEFDAKLEFDN